MSRITHISEAIVELTLTPGTLEHEALMHSPQMQIDYLSRGLISLDDLTPEQIEVIDDIVFRKEWMNIEHKLHRDYPGVESLTQAIYNGSVAVTRIDGERYARIHDLAKYDLLAEIDYQILEINKEEEKRS